jgi:hypothetical protein
VHFVPTGSSWINQVERWFGYLTDQLIGRGGHTSVQALERRPRLDQELEQRPTAIRMTKTAEEILTSLATYIARISGG